MLMFDIAKETPLSLADAAKLLPRKPNGNTIAVKTLVRWIMHGHAGVQLEAGRFGDSLCTSRESLARFSIALGKIKSGEGDAATAKKKDAIAPKRTRSKSHVAAKDSLKRSGWASRQKTASK